VVAPGAGGGEAHGGAADIATRPPPPNHVKRLLNGVMYRWQRICHMLDGYKHDVPMSIEAEGND